MVGEMMTQAGGVSVVGVTVAVQMSIYYLKVQQYTTTANYTSLRIYYVELPIDYTLMVRKESKIPSFCVSGSEHVTRFYIRLMGTFYTWGEQLLASAHERSQLKHQKLEVDSCRRRCLTIPV